MQAGRYRKEGRGDAKAVNISFPIFFSLLFLPLLLLLLPSLLLPLLLLLMLLLLMLLLLLLLLVLCCGCFTSAGRGSCAWRMHLPACLPLAGRLPRRRYSATPSTRPGASSPLVPVQGETVAVHYLVSATVAV